jgi:hypothetical protein
MDQASEDTHPSHRSRPWATALSLTLALASAVLGVAFKLAFWMRHDVSVDAQAQLDLLLRLLANSSALSWLGGVLMAFWALFRGERLGAVIAFALCILRVAAEFSVM